MAVYYDPATDDLYFILQDANYDVVGLTDEQGVLQQQYTLAPYGEFLFIENGTGTPYTGGDAVLAELLMPFGRNGLWFDRETGLYYNRARYYGPKFGRFWQRDPNETGLVLMSTLAMNAKPQSVLAGLTAEAQYTDGTNLYEVIQSRPTWSSDPGGLATEEHYGPWIADGRVKWVPAGGPFFFYNVRGASLPTAGWLGVILETYGAIFPVASYGFVDDFATVSRWPPGRLNNVMCFCPWKRQQPCKRCVTEAKTSIFSLRTDLGGVITQEWEKELKKQGYAVTRGIMMTRWTGYDYRCSCTRRPPRFSPPICPKKPKARCGCAARTGQ